MYGVELYAAVRLAVVDEGLSHHEAGRRFGIDRRTVKKMVSYSAPPGYRRPKPVRRPKLDGFTGIVDAILEADTDPDVPRKQRHTAHRIFERLRDEHGFAGGYTIVKDYVRSRRQSTREAFVPLHHPPGHAQVDFGEAVVEVGGRREKVAFFCLILPHSNVWFVKAYPRETTEAFLDGHVSAFAFLGGVPRSILYDNTTLAVARILGDGTRRRTQAFSHLQSHYLFRDRFGRPGKGNDKGKVEAHQVHVRLPQSLRRMLRQSDLSSLYLRFATIPTLGSAGLRPISRVDGKRLHSVVVFLWLALGRACIVSSVARGDPVIEPMKDFMGEPADRVRPRLDWLWE